jgi:hypothetical protein
MDLRVLSSRTALFRKAAHAKHDGQGLESAAKSAAVKADAGSLEPRPEA